MKKKKMSENWNRKNLRDSSQRPHYPAWRGTELSLHGVIDPFARKDDFNGNRG